MYRKARNFFYTLWYKNYAAIPCLGEKCKRKISFDFFFSSKFLVKITEEGGATDWAILVCPHCNQLIGFRLEANVVDVKTMRIDWRVRQTPPMTGEQIKKQFSTIE